MGQVRATLTILTTLAAAFVSAIPVSTELGNGDKIAIRDTEMPVVHLAARLDLTTDATYFDTQRLHARSSGSEDFLSRMLIACCGKPTWKMTGSTRQPEAAPQRELGPESSLQRALHHDRALAAAEARAAMQPQAQKTAGSQPQPEHTSGKKEVPRRGSPPAPM